MWSEDYKDAFAKLKECISSLLILTRLEDGETLFLYIVTSNEMVGIMLILEWDGE